MEWNLFFSFLPAQIPAPACFFLLDGNYEHFYYLTNDHHGEVLLRLLCCTEKTAALNKLFPLICPRKKRTGSLKMMALTIRAMPYCSDIFFIFPELTGSVLHSRYRNAQEPLSALTSKVKSSPPPWKPDFTSDNQF